MLRKSLVWLHRWTGLAMAGFLFVVGLTGAALAFNSELEHVFAPGLFATPRPSVPMLDLATLAELAVPVAAPKARVLGVTRTETDQVQVGVTPTIDPATGQPFALDYTQLYVDPWTGAELGRRRRGDLSQGLVNVMPFLYLVHWTLTPHASVTGSLVLGVVAIAWSLDCFVAFCLTLPITRRAFWRRWRLAWRIRRRGSAYRLNFDLHRATGLWLWSLLFVFAWSSVMFNIRPVYETVTSALVDYRSPRTVYAEQLTRPHREAPGLGWHEALAVGRRLMAEQAAVHKFRVIEPLGLDYSPRIGAYTYEVRSTRDVFERAPKGGSTSVVFDADSGAIVLLSMPTGERTGNTIESWLYALHMARVGGRPYQILTFVVGLAVSGLSLTGVYIWWKKRGFRRWIAARRLSGYRNDRGVKPIAPPRDDEVAAATDHLGHAGRPA